MHQRRIQLAGTWLFCFAISTWSLAEEPSSLESAYNSVFETANWQVPADAPVEVPVVPVIPPDPVVEEIFVPETVVPPAVVPAVPSPLIDEPYVPTGTPLLDGTISEEELIESPCADGMGSTRRGVRPYGGGSPGDWPWGCGGSPFRTGPGWCDTWEVGCRWDTAVDGMVMSRDTTDLLALESRMRMNDVTGTQDSLGMNLTPMVEQFDRGPGGRVSFISKFPHYTWQMHAGYEGIEEWNAAVVFPKLPLEVFALPEPGVPVPPMPIDLATEQRSLHYRTSLHSGELNFVRDCCSKVWRPYCGVRYVKFDDEINDMLNQQAPAPLPGDASLTVTTTDRLNLFDIENNLIGFQAGIRHDLWRPMRRLTVEGFVNAGVYYNKIKYTNLMGTFTTQQISDDTGTVGNETRVDFSNTVNNDVSELSEISYIGEASVSGVCRLNKCWALRAGYQALWITNLHLAEDAYLQTGIDSRDMFFHGWHAGVEHRR